MQAEVETERLQLRRWDESDREPFAELNADPMVMEYFTSTRTRAESNAFIDRVEAHFDQTGIRLGAVEVVASSEFAGFVGLWPPNFNARRHRSLTGFNGARASAPSNQQSPKSISFGVQVVVGPEADFCQASGNALC